MNQLTMIALLIAAALVVYYFVFNGRFDFITNPICSRCGTKTTSGQCPVCPSCPDCPTTTPESKAVMSNMITGCVEKLQAVMNESLTSKQQVLDFLAGGTNRLVIITNITIQELVQNMEQGTVSVAAIRSTVLDGVKKYSAIVISNGKIKSLTADASSPSAVFDVLNKAVREIDPTDENNLVMFIDDDIDCGTTSVDDEMSSDIPPMDATMMEAPLMEGPNMTDLGITRPGKESCCGRHH